MAHKFKISAIIAVIFASSFYAEARFVQGDIQEDNKCIVKYGDDFVITNCDYQDYLPYTSHSATYKDKKLYVKASYRLTQETSVSEAIFNIVARLSKPQNSRITSEDKINIDNKAKQPTKIPEMSDLAGITDWYYITHYLGSDEPMLAYSKAEQKAIYDSVDQWNKVTGGNPNAMVSSEPFDGIEKSSSSNADFKYNATTLYSCFKNSSSEYTQGGENNAVIDPNTTISSTRPSSCPSGFSPKQVNIISPQSKFVGNVGSLSINTSYPKEKISIEGEVDDYLKSRLEGKYDPNRTGSEPEPIEEPKPEPAEKPSGYSSSDYGFGLGYYITDRFRSEVEFRFGQVRFSEANNETPSMNAYTILSGHLMYDSPINNTLTLSLGGGIGMVSDAKPNTSNTKKILQIKTEILINNPSSSVTPFLGAQIRYEASVNESFFDANTKLRKLYGAEIGLMMLL